MLRTGTGAMLVVLIMFLGSLGLWVASPLLWLWVGSQIQGTTGSLGAAVVLAFIGVLLSTLVLGSLLSRLSETYRGNCVSRGMNDPGNVVLEGVLVVSAGLTLAGFVIWFFFFAGADPAPLGIPV